MPARPPADVEGLLNIDKPLGLTSHDVVDRIRRQTRVRRVGHAGTLDPQASGVLLIGLGRGTKLVQFMHECPKTYRATLRLGIRTDSHDAAGKVIDVRAVRDLRASEVETVLETFRGTIEQRPPMFSALKWQGQRLYTLARQGIDVVRQPRQVQIFRLHLLDLGVETVHLEVECSSGTYIRVLADDIGARLGCGAHLTALVRTAIGPFTREGAIALGAFEEAVRQHRWREHLVSLSAAVEAFPALMVTAAAAKALAHGVPPSRQSICHISGSFAAGESVAIVGEDGALLAMGSPMVGADELGTVAADQIVVKLRRVLTAGSQR
jgi:tRNA pseudouridine55 synthase